VGLVRTALCTDLSLRRLFGLFVSSKAAECRASDCHTLSPAFASLEKRCEGRIYLHVVSLEVLLTCRSPFTKFRKEVNLLKQSPSWSPCFYLCPNPVCSQSKNQSNPFILWVDLITPPSMLSSYLLTPCKRCSWPGLHASLTPFHSLFQSQWPHCCSQKAAGLECLQVFPNRAPPDHSTYHCLSQSDHYSKAPQTIDWVAYKQKLFLIILEAGSPSSRYQYGQTLVRALFWMQTPDFLKRAEKLSVSLVQGSYHIHDSHFPKPCLSWIGGVAQW
jgi:hypothetical protein